MSEIESVNSALPKHGVSDCKVRWASKSYAYSFSIVFLFVDFFIVADR